MERSEGLNLDAFLQGYILSTTRDALRMFLAYRLLVQFHGRKMQFQITRETVISLQRMYFNYCFQDLDLGVVGTGTEKVHFQILIQLMGTRFLVLI
jgi:hypothetical protein